MHCYLFFKYITHMFTSEGNMKKNLTALIWERKTFAIQEHPPLPRYSTFGKLRLILQRSPGINAITNLFLTQIQTICNGLSVVNSRQIWSFLWISVADPTEATLLLRLITSGIYRLLPKIWQNIRTLMENSTFWGTSINLEEAQLGI